MVEEIGGEMKKLLIVSLFLFGAWTTWAETEAQSAFEQSAETISPCRYWTSATGGGYKCQSHVFSMRVPDARDVDMEIRRLERRIERLENKISELESK